MSPDTHYSMTPVISVVLCTYNPRADFLERVVGGLKAQALPRERWELIVVDNNSQPPVRAGSAAVAGRNVGKSEGEGAFLDLSWHGNARIVREEKLGLTFARLRGFSEARAELIVMVDDDNLLAQDYLETAVRIAEERPTLGAFGGKCLPEFEHEPPEWLRGMTSGLGLRNLGEEPVVYPWEGGNEGQWEGERGGLRDQELKRPKDEGPLWCEGGKVERSEGGSLQALQPAGLTARREDGSRKTQGGGPKTANCQRRAVHEFPDCAPIGAGMVLRRNAAAAYAKRLNEKTKRPKDQETITDRKGDSLASGGDNDICLTVIEEGWQVGYLPQLKLAHLIPTRRMSLDYQRRMARDSMKSFILMLDQHGIHPWSAMPKWTLPLRVASDWCRVRPWRSPEASLRFWGNVGMYEGRAALPARRRQVARR